MLTSSLFLGDRGNDGLSGLPGRHGPKGEPGQLLILKIIYFCLYLNKSNYDLRVLPANHIINR
jgi:hypothetical protein